MTDARIEINPPNLEADYLRGLNRCFGAWGDEAGYRWDFEREVGAGPADLMVIRGEEGTLVAGSAVSYRVVRHAGRDEPAGIMTGSWTLPEARGQGAFSRMIVASGRLVAGHGGRLLIAFVTEDNASRRRLAAAGCLEVPTSYVMSGPETPAPSGAPDVAPSDAGVDALYAAHCRWQEDGPGAVFRYPSAEAWASQLLHRPLPVERVVAAGCECLIERSATSDRLLWIVGRERADAIAALLDRSVAAGRQLFYFTLDPALAGAGADLGLTVRPGSITVLGATEADGVTAPDASLPSTWRLQGGERA